MDIHTIRKMEKISRETYGKWSSITDDEAARYNAAACLYHIILAAEDAIGRIANETEAQNKKGYSEMLKVFDERISLIIKGIEKEPKR